MSLVDTVGSLAVASKCAASHILPRYALLLSSTRGHFMTGVSTGRMQTFPFRELCQGVLAGISGSFLKPGGTVGETLCIRGKVVGFGTS